MDGTLWSCKDRTGCVDNTRALCQRDDLGHMTAKSKEQGCGVAGKWLAPLPSGSVSFSARILSLVAKETHLFSLVLPQGRWKKLVVDSNWSILCSVRGGREGKEECWEAVPLGVPLGDAV